MRGVEKFIMEPSSLEGQYIAKLKVYKHANGWWYWRTFMQKTGIPHFRINNTTYTAEELLTIE